MTSATMRKAGALSPRARRSARAASISAWISSSVMGGSFAASISSSQQTSPWGDNGKARCRYSAGEGLSSQAEPGSHAPRRSRKIGNLAARVRMAMAQEIEQGEHLEAGVVGEERLEQVSLGVKTHLIDDPPARVAARREDVVHLHENAGRQPRQQLQNSCTTPPCGRRTWEESMKSTSLRPRRRT